jgi:hypothetical protein
VVAPLDEAGVFVDGFAWLTGQNVHDVAQPIFDDLQGKGRLYRLEEYTHRYPVCWRCKTELIFRLVDEWFISMGEVYDKPREELTPEEIDLIALRGANVVLNPIGNLKTRSGVAPIRGYMEAKVNVGLGCDNCSCGDAQNMFQAMKLFASLAAICDPEPGPPTAADAIRAATVGGARTAGLQDKIGALRPGMAADLTIIDLSDPSFVPLTSVARQVVFTESGRGVESVMVDGRIVVRDRKITTIDERALREDVAALMGPLRADLAAVLERNDRMLPYILEANRRTWAVDIGLNRYVGDAARAGF